MIITSHLTPAARVLSLAVIMSLAAPAQASNQALMELFKILRDKGSLTAAEYQMLVNAANADDAASKAEQQAHEPVSDKAAVIAKVEEKPSWTESIALKGDVRTRYEHLDEDGSRARSRGRLRYRLAVIATPAAGLEVGAGIASGSGDQRSTNQSFDESFSGKNINLDYAYMQYAFAGGLSAIAGKFSFKNYLWAPTDVMWDSDINPEGFSANYRGGNAWGTAFANAGIWVLEENAGSSDDPYMAYGQIGQNWQVGPWFGTVSAAAYGFADVNFVADLTRSEGTNTDSKLSSVNLATEIGTAVGAGSASLLGEYINNVETNTAEDTVWALGAKYAWSQWSMKYIYADVEANAVPDFLPDSDRFDGLTGVRGHEFEIQYEIIKRVTLALDFYHMEDIATHVDQNQVLADVNVKF